jgi:hypothetical protein
VALQDHLVGGVIVGPARVPQQRGNLITRLQKAGERVQILGIGAGIESEVDALAQRIAFGKRQYRQSVGIVGRDADFAVRSGLVAIDEIRRKSV